MRHAMMSGLAAVALLGCGSAALADEVTTKTTTTTTDPTVVVTPPPAAVVTDAPSCNTKQVTKTNGDTGETVKKTATNCD